jgi:adenylosuccinate synthase
MRKNVTVVVGGQFGSEAKGKVISFLAREFDVAVRTGAPNAGHTVLSGDKEYRLQQIPATFLNRKCQLFIGPGALIDAEVLKREIVLTGTKARLFIDNNAGTIDKKHALSEKNLMSRIGSTGKGVGAATIDRINRNDFKLASSVLRGYHLADTVKMVNVAIDQNKNVLVEGTQGFGLSIYHGTYPFVTSRDTTASNFLVESGISPLAVKDIILVIRTFPIRVAGNSGPLKNEISWGELSIRVGKNVLETTTVTKRIRRVAEFDLELVKRAVLVNRPTQIALQFLNYLFPEDENANEWRELSQNAKKYIIILEKKLGVPITLIGTGRDNYAMIDRRN